LSQKSIKARKKIVLDEDKGFDRRKFWEDAGYPSEDDWNFVVRESIGHKD
jgi:hypothetical protein